MFVSTSTKTVKMLGKKGARNLDLQFSNVLVRCPFGRIHLRIHLRKSNQTPWNLPTYRTEAKHDASHPIYLDIHTRQSTHLGHNVCNHL